jgi:hypothetical protein
MPYMNLLVFSLSLEETKASSLPTHLEAIIVKTSASGLLRSSINVGSLEK